METIIHAVKGDKIEVSVEALNPDETVLAYFLDSKQHHLAEAWKPGAPPTFMPVNRAIFLTGKELRVIIPIPYEDDWLIVVDAEAGKKPHARILTSNDAV